MPSARQRLQGIMVVSLGSKKALYFYCVFAIALLYAVYVANIAVFQSDWAAMFIFFDEVARTGSMATYFMPPTPAVFQTVAYMLPVYLLFGMSGATIYFVIFLQTVVNVVALAVLLLLLFPPKRRDFPKMALFVLGLTLTGPLLQIIDPVMFRKDIPLLLLALWYVFRVVESRSFKTVGTKILTALCVLFLLIQSYGDPYVMFMLLAPLVLTNVVYVLLKKPHPVHTLWLSVVAVACSVSAMILRWFSALYLFHLYAGISSVGGPRYWLPSLGWFVGDIDMLMPFLAVFGRPSLTGAYLLAVLNAVVLVLMLVMIFYVIKLSFMKAHQFMFFIATLPILSSGVYILTYKPAQHMTRYHILTVFVLYIIVVFGLVHGTLLRKKVRAWAFNALGLSLLVQTILLAQQLIVQFADMPKYLQLDHDAEFVAVLRERGLTKGYGGYWDSMSVSYVSQLEHTVYPVTCFGGEVLPHYWFSFSQWYEVDPEVERTFLYVSTGERSFTASCQEDDLRRQFGPESERIVVGEGKYLYVWPYDIAEKLNKTNLDEDLLFTSASLERRFQKLWKKIGAGIQ